MHRSHFCSRPASRVEAEGRVLVDSFICPEAEVTSWSWGIQPWLRSRSRSHGGHPQGQQCSLGHCQQEPGKAPVQASTYPASHQARLPHNVLGALLAFPGLQDRDRPLERHAAASGPHHRCRQEAPRTGLWGRHCHLPPCSAGETDTRRNKITCLRSERRCWDFHVAPRLGLSDPVSIRFRLSPLLPGRPVTGTSGGKAPTTLSSAPISEPLSLLLTVPALPSLLLTTLFPTGGQESWC